MTTLPRDFPGLRAEAERIARESMDTLARIDSRFYSFDDLPTQEDDDRGPGYGEAFTNAQAALLCDLTRLASREWLARQIFSKLHVAPAVLTPFWCRSAPFSWRKGYALVPPGAGDYPTIYFEESYRNKYTIPIPGIENLEPPDALLVAALHVFSPNFKAVVSHPSEFAGAVVIQGPTEVNPFYVVEKDGVQHTLDARGTHTQWTHS